MSIASIPENKLNFQGGNNVRIAIAGLSICKFATAGSTIRFLRHVPKHQLSMKIIQKLASGEIVGDVSYTLGAQLKTITIAGAETSGGFEYKPGYYSEYELKMMMDLRFLHGHPLDQKAGSPSDSLTVMTINNCLFYTAKLTDDEFDLVKNNSPIGIIRRFGEILGGYMRVADDKELVITIPGLIASPIRLPVKTGDVKYFYEIQFNNSCFEADGKPCQPTEPTDFLKIYDILQDNMRPYEEYDLKRLSERLADTGACLPTVEEPCLNC